MISAAEYLSTSFDNPDREYVRGKIVERGMPDLFHSAVQGELAYCFRRLRDSHQLFPYLSIRLRLASDLYRVPDVAVFAGERPAERFPRRPPLVAIEIISDDRFSAMMQKLAEYDEWGVRHIWVVDPERRALGSYEEGTLRTETRLTLPGYPIEFSDELFS